MSFRRMTLLDDSWRDVSGNYQTTNDPNMPNVAGLTAPWLMGNALGSAFVVFDLKGVKAANFLVEGADDPDGVLWVNALDPLNADTVRHFPRWVTPPYYMFRVTVTGFEADPSYDGHSINIYLES